jgi:hypothetical protein
MDDTIDMTDADIEPLEYCRAQRKLQSASTKIEGERNCVPLYRN